MNWIETQINGAVVRIAFDANSIHFFDAYPIKEELKRDGFRWNPDDKSWFINVKDPKSILEKWIPQQQIVTDQPPQTQETGGQEEPDRGCSIRQLRDRIEAVLTAQLPPRVWVRGVIVSEIKQYRWAAYFDLGDDEGETPFFFRVEVPGDQLARIEKKLSDLGTASKLEKDLPVLLCVSLSLAARYVVDVRLTVLDILPEYTQSKLRNQREITLERLKAEGIADRQRSLDLPMLVQRVGIITSAQGTSLEDIRSAMAPHAHRYQLLFADARMEGALAVTQIMAAIRRFNQLTRPPDLIILARGGGSEQSLAVFNEYRICREVCLSAVPILAAIGHEKDLSATELCAHLMPTPSTPSGAGRFLAQRWQGLVDKLEEQIRLLIEQGRGLVMDERHNLGMLLRHLPQTLQRRRRYESRHLADHLRLFRQQGLGFLTAQERGIRRELSACLKNTRYRVATAKSDLNRMRQRLPFEIIGERRRKQLRDIDMVRARLLFAGRRIQDRQLERVSAQEQVVRAHAPQSVLKRGFTLLFDTRGKVLTSRERFVGQQKGTLQFHDGTIEITAGETGE